MREELVLNVEQIANGPEDYDALREAVNRLTAASENQFEEIKKEKWYNRVFDMITFSKKNEKRLAEQISTLAQAQQILVELLLRLAQNDANISQLVLENTDNIRRLSENDIYLLERIKKLEERAQGIHDDTDFRMLSEKAKKVLCALLYKLSERKSSNEAQTAFANAILSYLGENDVQMDSPFAALADFEEDTKTRKAMLACCMEYIYLGTCTDDAYDEYQDFIDEFDFGRKTVESIKAQISKICAFRGAEGLYKKYVTEEEEKISDSFYVEMEDVSEEDIINGCEWYPVFEKKNVGADEDEKTLTDIYIVMKEEADIRKTVRLDVMSGKAYGNYIYYVAQDDDCNLILYTYCISEKTETEIGKIYGRKDDGNGLEYCSILDCTNKWLVCLFGNVHFGKVLLHIFNLQTKLGDTIKLPMHIDECSSLAIVGDFFFMTSLEKELYRGNMNTMEIAKVDSIATSNIYEWVGKLHAEGRYLYGFWEDYGSDTHYVKYDTEKNLVVETCKVDYKKLGFKYNSPLSCICSVYCNDKMYTIGYYPYGTSSKDDKLVIICFDMKTHETSLVAEYDTKRYSENEIHCSLQEENEKVRCEIIFDAQYHYGGGLANKRKHIKEYF